LPMALADFTPAHFNQWERLADYVALRDSLPRGEVTLIDVFARASALNAQLGDVEEMLVQATGWDPVVVASLSGPAIFNFTPARLKDERPLLRLRDAIDVVKRVGAAPEALFAWAAGPLDSAQSRAIKDVAKAKYDNDTWLTIAAPLTDR